MGNHWKQWQAIFLVSKITADGDCCHEIKIRLFLERKAMANLDSILKSRDITLPTKVHLVKAMVKLKDACSFEKKYDQPRQHIKKQRHYFTNKGPTSQSYVFIFFPVVMYGCESWIIKKAEHQRIDAFELWC